MKSIKLILFLCILVILSSCQLKNFDKIPKEIPLLITFNLKENSLSFFNENGHDEIAKWNFDEPFSGALLLPDDNILLYGRHVENVVIYNLTSGERIEKWDTGKGVANALFSIDKSYIFLANQQQNAIQIFDLNGDNIKTIPVNKGPLTLVENKQENKLYVVHFDDPIISTITLNTLEVMNTFSSTKRAVGSAVSNKNELWVGGHGEGKNIQREIIIYKLPDGEIVNKVKAGVMPIEILHDGKYMYTLSHGTNTLSKIDEKNYEILEEITVGSNPFSMTLTEENLYIASYDSNEIIVVDLENMKTMKSIKTGEGPFEILFRKGA